MPLLKAPAKNLNQVCSLVWFVRTLGFVCLFAAITASAHEPSKSYLSLTLDSGRITGQWDIPLRDLQKVTPLQLDMNRSTDREQLAACYDQVTSYAFSHLQIVADGCVMTPQLTGSPPVLEEFSDGEYLQLGFIIDHFSASQIIELNYQLFFETNSLHRGLVRLQGAGKTQVTTFSPSHHTQQFVFESPTPGLQLLVFLREGVWHIWTGYDHILFLIALLLPSVLRRDSNGWHEVGALRSAFFNVLKIVTAFTAAHSITLSLATLGYVKLPSRLTESAIALSVALAAVNNLWPIIRERSWIVAFGFGLIHGFGFATALSDLGPAHGALSLALIGFNLGVELGQLAIVACFLPIAFFLRRTWFYKSPMLRVGSAFIVLIAVAWCSERVLDVKFMPF